MLNKIIFTNETKREIDLKIFQNVLDAFVKLENYQKPLQVDLLITNAKKVKSLNQQYRKKDSTTDVLSFPFEDVEFFSFLDYTPFGQIVFDYDKVIKQAKEFNHSQLREWSYLFAHGLLHLSGLDHQSESDAKFMNDKADKIMEMLNITRD